MFTINAEVRKEQGKGASRRLRAANKFPAIIYGGKEAPLAIELDHDKVMNMQAKAEFYSEVLTIVVDGKEIKPRSGGVFCICRLCLITVLLFFAGQIRRSRRIWHSEHKTD